MSSSNRKQKFILPTENHTFFVVVYINDGNVSVDNIQSMKKKSLQEDAHPVCAVHCIK